MTETYSVSLETSARTGRRVASCSCRMGFGDPNWARQHVRQHEAMIAFRAHRRDRKAARR